MAGGTLGNALAGGAQLQLVSSYYSNITAHNDIESNYKDYYTIYFKYRSGIFNTNDSIVLKNLVDGCPARDGMAVRQARALYSMIYNIFSLNSDICSDINPDKESNTIKKNPIVSKDFIILYPNPTTGNFWLEFNDELNHKNAEIFIFNIVGSIVFKENLSITNSNKISLNLESGTYFISINIKDVTSENYNAKIIVIK